MQITDTLLSPGNFSRLRWCAWCDRLLGLLDAPETRTCRCQPLQLSVAARDWVEGWEAILDLERARRRRREASRERARERIEDFEPLEVELEFDPWGWP